MERIDNPLNEMEQKILAALRLIKHDRKRLNQKDLEILALDITEFVRDTVIPYYRTRQEATGLWGPKTPPTDCQGI